MNRRAANQPDLSETLTSNEAMHEGTALDALKRHDLPDLETLIKTDPGAPFEHAEAFATMRDKAPADWARVKAALKDRGVTIGDLERAMGQYSTSDDDGKQVNLSNGITRSRGNMKSMARRCSARLPT